VQVEMSGPIKIGFSVDFAARLRVLQDFSPWDLTVRMLVDGTMLNEAYVHQLCTASRLKGEWFKPTKEVLGVIAAISARDWVWPNSSTARRRSSSETQAERARAAVLSAALPVQAGDTVKRQIERAALRLGMSNNLWRIRGAWYGEAGTWAAHKVTEIEERAALLAAPRLPPPASEPGSAAFA
jgi:hypothetical protein